MRKGRSVDPLDLMPRILTSQAAAPKTKAERMKELRALRKRLNIK